MVRMVRRGIVVTQGIGLSLALLVLLAHREAGAQEPPPQPPRPRVELLAADPLDLSGDVDSNSPVMWAPIDGLPSLRVFTSTAGVPSVADGLRLRRLEPAQPVTIVNLPGHGMWFEAVVADDQDV